MISLLAMLSFAQAELLIQSNLQNHYILGQEILVDIQFQNTGDVPEVLPDYAKQTWKISWSITHDGTTQKRQSAEQQSTEEWILKPRQIKEIRFAIPHSATFSAGKHLITLNISLPQSSYSQTSEIWIHPRSALWEDWQTKAEPVFFPEQEHLWGQSISQKEQMIYLENERSIPLFVTSKPLRFEQSISNTEHHIYQYHGQTIEMMSIERERVQDRRKISLPWKDSSLLARGVTDELHTLHLPVWIANPNGSSGTVRSVQISHKGAVSYRKIISLPEKPISFDTAITHNGTPLYLVQTQKQLYLFPLLRMGDEKVDQLPPQNITISNQSTDNTMHSGFAVDTEQGLVIHVVQQQENTLTSSLFSLQAKPISQKQFSIPANGLHITEALYHQKHLAILARDEHSRYWLKGEQWTILPVSDYPPSQKIRLIATKDKGIFPTTLTNEDLIISIDK